MLTLPHRLDPWVQSHPEVIYRALFQAAWGTLDAFGHDPKRLGRQRGMTGVLHTWGQNLCQHVHLHCMVPGGALADDGIWLPARGSYLFPVRALSRHFRGRMVNALRSAARAGELTGLDPAAVSALLDALMGKEWVVFTKPSLEHTASPIGHLARYTYRIVIGNARIECVDPDQMSSSYRGYATAGKRRRRWTPRSLSAASCCTCCPRG